MGSKTDVKKIADTRLVSVTSRTKTGTALKILENSNLSIVPVIDDGRLVGILNFESMKEKEKFGGSVKELMDRPLFVESGKSIDYAIRYITRHSLSRVPVVESAIGMHCIGIVSASRLLKAKKSMRK